MSLKYEPSSEPLHIFAKVAAHFTNKVCAETACGVVRAYISLQQT
jgi:hypothetical protein